MPEYRRSLVEGGTFFFTVVTYNRQPIFNSDLAKKLLHIAWKSIEEDFPFTTDAICLLPDHLHCIWTLPENEVDYSSRWNAIKRLFTQSYLLQGGISEARNKSHITRREAAVWQRRFWEHTIRNQEDYNKHLDYIHYNPVKHGLVTNVADWPWSPKGALEASFHRYVKKGYYHPD